MPLGRGIQNQLPGVYKDGRPTLSVDTRHSLWSLVVVLVGLGAVLSVQTVSPQSMFQENAQHTGQSSSHGPQSNRIKCTFPLEGNVVGSPVVGVGGTTIYVPSGSRSKGIGFLYAVHRNCTQKWRFDLRGAPGATTPAVAKDGTVYVHTNGSGSSLGIERLVAINPDGTEQWQFAFNNGAAVFTSDVLSSPAIAKAGTIWIGSQDTYLYGLKPDGTVKCADSPTGSAIDSSPAIAPDETVYIVDASTQLFAYTPNCDKKWTFKLSSPPVGTANPQSPSIGPNGTVYVGSPNDYLYAVNPENGKERCRFQTGWTIQATPAVDAEGTVYVASDGLYALDGHDCSEKWPQKFPNTTVLFSSASPTLGVDGMIYWREGRTAYAITPSGTKKWSRRVSPGQGLDPSAAIGTAGELYMSDGGFFARPRLMVVADGCDPRLSPPTIEGTDGDDRLDGTPGNDIIYGYGGNDEINGQGGNDLICGGDGDDTLSGGNGDDWLDGGGGNDTLFGENGQDFLVGAGGDDTLEGGPGSDACYGGLHAVADTADATCERIITVP